MIWILLFVSILSFFPQIHVDDDVYTTPIQFFRKLMQVMATHVRVGGSNRVQ
jgi:hypothetical protein